MAIIEVMNTPINSQSFTANAAVAGVRTQFAGVGPEFNNANGFSVFEDGDNLFLKKIKVIRPYSFGPANYNLADYKVRIEWLQGAVEKDIPEFGFSGFIHLDSLCGDTDINLKLAAPEPGAGNFELRLTGYDLEWSQLNLPALIDGQPMYFGFQLQLEHTKPMIS